ncbi:hypothetical protein [Nocardia puris]|uniref:Uncharacterized protein n=1 Tax=Nocardia puris TaxID=208602 RepID=A0A366DXT4_9NOCA|nr:hypothetical protein [Nocardia puris]RBO94094.1 hypothetical protein DFR74_102516 [Nocardia puris]
MVGMTQTQFRALLTDLAAADFGGWRRADVHAVCAGSGWKVSREVLPRCEIAAVPGAVRGAYLTENWDRRRDSESEMMQLYLCAAVTTPERFRAHLEVATEVWGEPSLYGGSRNAFSRWRGPVVSRQLEIDREGSVLVRAFCTEAWESWDHRTWEWDDAVDDVPYTWLGDNGHPSLAGFHTGGRVAGSWPGLVTALTGTLRDIRFGMRALGVGGPAPTTDGVVISLESAAGDSRVVQLVQGVDELTVLVGNDHPDPESLARRGLARDEYDAWTSVFAPDHDPRPAAELAVSLLRDLGFASVGELAERSWRFASPYRRFSLHCVGVQRARGR